MSRSLRLFWRVHRTFMRLTGGRFGKVGPMNGLLLTTTGRKSGERRDVALNYMPDGDSYIVIASNVGDDRDPAWWRNLKANPAAEVSVGGKRLRVRAREADGAERDSLWIRIVATDPAYAEYQQRTRRRLPVVVLQPETALQEGMSER